MSALFIALPVALLLALAGVIAFVWSVRTGQLDDLETPAIRPLIEDEPVARPRDENRTPVEREQR
jgi:cbb3-type cytochrome oxidase maturation protein